jgi:DNA-binding PucR family transcriptional regulator
MIILTYEKSVLDAYLDCDYFFSLLNINKEEYFIGKAVFRPGLDVLDQSIKEAVYALEACELQEKPELAYDSIGIYKLLLPHKGKWMSTYVDSILKPLYDYDDGKLLETARTYIEYQGDIVKTAQVLFQHKNTIRYRLSKMKSLLNTKSDGDFYEQLSVAIKCEKL